MGRDLAAELPVRAAHLRGGRRAPRLRALAPLLRGAGGELALTEHAQPAILAASVAAFRVLAETSGARRRSCVAGHSLGEWSALVAAGALAFGDAVRGVRERGRLMQAAVPAGVGAMAALHRCSSVATVSALCDEAAGGEVVAPANLNGAGQIVVAGHAGAVERRDRWRRRRGACARSGST